MSVPPKTPHSERDRVDQGGAITRNGSQQYFFFDVFVNIVKQRGRQRGTRGINVAQGCELVIFPGSIHFLWRNELTAEVGSSWLRTNR